jgi:hypothetical protein
MMDARHQKGASRSPTSWMIAGISLLRRPATLNSEASRQNAVSEQVRYVNIEG